MPWFTNIQNAIHFKTSFSNSPSAMTCFEVMKLERCVNLTRYFSPTTLRSLECLCFCVLLSNLLCSINPIENKASRLYITNES